MDLDDCPHCGAELEITWTTANPGALLGDQVAVPRSMRCPNANRDEVERLRELLGRLEWAGCIEDITGSSSACPACEVEEGDPHGHEPGCWLAKELGR
jgi:hypothetical protein